VTEADPTKTGRKPNGRFGPGNRGNPNGRPAGSRNKASLLLAELIDNEGEGIVRAMIEAAKGGDTSAGRCLVDRLVPPRKDRPIRFALPPLETAADAPRAVAAIVQAVAAGELSAAEAGDLAGLVGRFSQVIEVTEIETRLRAIEERVNR